MATYLIGGAAATTPNYLIGGAGCERALATCYGCAAAVRVNPTTGRWFVTMGHPGFNTPANNGRGYATWAAAAAAVRRYGRR